MRIARVKSGKVEGYYSHSNINDNKKKLKIIGIGLSIHLVPQKIPFYENSLRGHGITHTL